MSDTFFKRYKERYPTLERAGSGLRGALELAGQEFQNVRCRWQHRGEGFALDMQARAGRRRLEARVDRLEVTGENHPARPGCRTRLHQNTNP